MSDKVSFLKKLPIKWIVAGFVIFVILAVVVFLGWYLFAKDPVMGVLPFQNEIEQMVEIPSDEFDEMAGMSDEIPDSNIVDDEVAETPGEMLALVPVFEDIFSLGHFEDVKLKSKGNVKKTITAQIDIEFEGENVWDELNKNSSLLFDEVVAFFHGKTAREILNVEGRTALKYELINVISRQLKNKSIRNIYFIEFIVKTEKL